MLARSILKSHPSIVPPVCHPLRSGRKSYSLESWTNESGLVESEGVGWMSLERWSQLPGGYQITHRRLGVFQGTAAGMACWHPSSGVPEYGLCRFDTETKAQAYIDFFCSAACEEPLDPKDFSIEQFDRDLHDRLINDHPLPSAWEVSP